MTTAAYPGVAYPGSTYPGDSTGNGGGGGGGGGGSATTITDTFTRADSTTTLGSTESPVLAWTANAGTWGISTSRAYSVSNGDGDTATISVGQADMMVSAEITSLGANRWPGVVARFVDVGNSYLAEVNSSSGNLVLYRRVGASNTSMTTITFAEGDVVGLSTVEESGSTRVILYKNSVQQFTTLDSTAGRPAGTSAGLRWGVIGTPGQAYFDNFAVVYTGPAVPMTDFGIPIPILDIGFAAGAQSLPYWHVGDPVRGIVGTAVVGSSAVPFVEIPLSRLVTFTVDRGAQRVDSPLIRYDAGTATIVLTDPNSEFDPDNLLGPYAAVSTISDSFTRPDSTTTLGSAQSPVLAWTAHRGVWGISSNQAYSVTQALPSLATIQVGYADHDVSAKIVPLGEDVGLVASYVDENSYYFAQINASGTVAVGRVQGGAYIFFDYNLSGWFSGSTLHLVTDSSGGIGTQVSVLVGSTQIYTGLDTTAGRPAGTRAGLRGGTGSTPGAARYDNFTVVYTAPMTAGVSQVTPMVPIRLRVRYGTDVYPLFYGFADSWNLSYTSPLDAQVTIRATDAFKIFRDPGGRSVLGAPAGAGETTGARINRILDSVGWGAGDRYVDTGDQTVQATTFEGSALDEMYLTADSELGELYVQPDGKVRFRARSAIRTDGRSITSQAVFGNWQHVDDGELPYKDRALDYGEGRIVNRVLATNVNGTEQEKNDVPSRTRYGVKSFERTDLILQTDTDALMWAGLILYQSKDLEQWFTSLDVDPRALGGSLYPQVFGREIGDRITVRRRPLVGTSPITRDCFIRGISHSFGPGPNRWATKWSLQSATKYTFFTVGNANTGVVGVYGIA